jgi:hypothetical protein
MAEGDDTGSDPGEGGGLRGEVARLRARVAELNEEAKGHRLNAKEAREGWEAAKAELARVTKEAGDKVAAAEAAAKDAGERVIATLRDAALKVGAKDAGMHDLDGLRLLDTSGVKVGEDGTVEVPKDFWDTARKTKPYLFQVTGADTGTTAPGAKAPPPKETKPGTPKSVADMTPDERAATYRELGVRLPR